MRTHPLAVGHTVTRTLTFTGSEIIAGAVFLGDTNPFHNDEVAATERFGALIAAGPHVAGIHACMIPAFFTGIGISLLGTKFTTNYRAPVLANVLHELSWTISSITTHRRGGELVDWTGTVSALSENSTSPMICIEATGQVLVLPA